MDSDSTSARPRTCPLRKEWTKIGLAAHSEIHLSPISNARPRDYLQPGQVGDLARRVVCRNLHVKCRARVAQILCGEHSALLPNEQRGRVRVAADVVLKKVSC
jgi:hypothetical protein